MRKAIVTEYTKRCAELFETLRAVIVPEEPNSDGARVRINVQLDCWSTATHQSAFGVNFTRTINGGAVQRRFVWLLGIPTDFSQRR